MILKYTIVIVVALFLPLHKVHGQTNSCTPTAIAACGSYPCVQTGSAYSCLCPDMTLQSTAAACNGAVTTTTTQSTGVISNPCGNAICPTGATCIAVCQNPPVYRCLCPNNVLANPNCPTTPLAYNPCLTNNPCRNGGTCVVNQSPLQAICVCPSGTYGPNCAYSCRPACNYSWCYNGGRCINAYGRPFCSCPRNYRGRRCEMRNHRYNYVYLFHYPRW